MLEVEDVVWEPEFYEEVFTKVGFKSFEWIQSKLPTDYVDSDGYLNDYFELKQEIFFKAFK